jgi:hypothetical protein
MREAGSHLVVDERKAEYISEHEQCLVLGVVLCGDCDIDIVSIDLLDLALGGPFVDRAGDAVFAKRHGCVRCVRWWKTCSECFESLNDVQR